MNNITIIPIVDDSRVLVNIIGDKYEFYRTIYEDDDCYRALFNFCEVKNITIRDVHKYPDFKYDGTVMIVNCEIEDVVFESDDEYQNFILLDGREIFDALADDTITNLVDYVLFERIYTNYLK